MYDAEFTRDEYAIAGARSGPGSDEILGADHPEWLKWLDSGTSGRADILLPTMPVEASAFYACLL